MLKPMDICPSCGEGLTGRTLSQAPPDEHARLRRPPMREVRRCASCGRLAWRPKGSSLPWDDGGVDPSYDYLFAEPKPLPSPWILVPTAQVRATLEAELRVEVVDGHPLFGKPVIAVARCGQCDEVLFSIEEDPVRFVQVHLTWRQGPERPPWPSTEHLSLPLSSSLTDHAH
jgi:hypothetical protein